MRIKGYTILSAAQAQPIQMPSGAMALPFSKESAQALGFPGNNDIIMCFRTGDPMWVEIVCVADVPKRCASIDHLLEAHIDEIEDLLVQFKTRSES
jgi:hypothetical protein